MAEVELPEDVHTIVTALAHELGLPYAQVLRLALETLLDRDRVLKRGVITTIGDDEPL